MLPKLSSKDKSLLLLIASGLISIWAIYSIFSYIFFNSTFNSSAAAKIITDENLQKQLWINLERPLKKSDLKNRVILLEFWTYDCVGCLRILPEIKNLEKTYGNKLTIIGVHSGKFENQKDIDAIKKAVLKHDITHAVLDDSNLKLWNEFKIKSWPTLVLIDARGNVRKTYSGDFKMSEVAKDVDKTINSFFYQLNHDALPILPEKNKIAKRVLSYPTKIEYTQNFSYKSYNAPALFIANSGQNNIVVSSLTGEIITEIGSGKNDFKDGNFENAAFSDPHGMLYDKDRLYVADRGNHAIREVNFKTEKVSTIIGDGSRGDVIKDSVNPADARLSSPSDIKNFPDNKRLVIANSGTNQILQYDIAKQTLTVLAGNGDEGISDGKYPQNSLAQTADLAVYDGKLYFVDSESSTLRVLEHNGEVKTLIGKGLLEFGYKNGHKKDALMQHPLGLMADDTGIYIVDSFNNAIRKYNITSGELQTLLGGKRGDGIGAKSAVQFDEPEGILSILDRFYVADSNNSRILVINRNSLNADLLDVMPQLQLPKEGFLQYLPNLYKAEKATIDKKDSTLKLNLQKGWKINDMGPSFINLLEMTSDDKANLIATFDWNMIKDNDLKLPELDEKKDYVLQGTIYYCENKKNALCYISSYEQQIQAIADSKNKSVTIELLYQ